MRAIRAWHQFRMHFALIACRPTDANDALVRATGFGATWETMTPGRALAELRPGDGAIGRLDVLPTLDGMDDGLWALGALSAHGVVVLNDPSVPWGDVFVETALALAHEARERLACRRGPTAAAV